MIAGGVRARNGATTIRPVGPPVKFLVPGPLEMRTPSFVFATLLAVTAPAAAQRPTELTVDAITQGAFAGARLPEPQWLADGSAYFDLRPARDGGSEIVRVNPATGAATVIAPAASLLSNGTRLLVESIVISHDGSKILLLHNSVRVLSLIHI